MRRSLFQQLLFGVLLLAAIELALLNFSLVTVAGLDPGAAADLRWRMALGDPGDGAGEALATHSCFRGASGSASYG
jgi:hypothetical protein